MATSDLFPDTVANKRCGVCGIEKPTSEFYFDKRYGLPVGQCKPCRIDLTGRYARANREKGRKTNAIWRKKNSEKRKTQLKNWRLANPEKVRLSARKQNRRRTLLRFNITEDEFLAAFLAQGAACAICRRPLDFNGGRQTHIDHCHSTNKFRGFLCLTCNTGLGKFRDDPVLLRRAEKYLIRI
jgi:hypothetical protein